MRYKKEACGQWDRRRRDGRLSRDWAAKGPQLLGNKA